MQPCTLCNMPVCTLPYFFSAPSFGFFNRAFNQSDCRSLASVITSLVLETNQQTNKQTNQQTKMVFLANCSLCMFYSTLSFFCLNRSCNIQACIYIFYFILFCPLMIKLYRRVFFFVKLPPVIEPQQCKEIVCSRNKRNKN